MSNCEKTQAIEQALYWIETEAANPGQATPDAILKTLRKSIDLNPDDTVNEFADPQTTSGKDGGTASVFSTVIRDWNDLKGRSEPINVEIVAGNQLVVSFGNDADGIAALFEINRGKLGIHIYSDAEATESIAHIHSMDRGIVISPDGDPFSIAKDPFYGSGEAVIIKRQQGE